MPLDQRAGSPTVQRLSAFEYRYLTEFQSHEPEFDYLKSLEIEEKINQVGKHEEWFRLPFVHGVCQHPVAALSETAGRIWRFALGREGASEQYGMNHSRTFCTHRDCWLACMADHWKPR